MRQKIKSTLNTTSVNTIIITTLTTYIFQKLHNTIIHKFTERW